MSRHEERPRDGEAPGAGAFRALAPVLDLDAITGLLVRLRLERGGLDT